MLITFEGIDGCGKSTQIELLANWLESRGTGYALFREPGGTRLSEQIRDLLLDRAGKMDPVTELLLFSAARSQLVTEKLLPLLEQGTLVVLDRFYDSTTAYQGYGRRSATAGQLEMLNALAAHGLVPDLTFYLKLRPEMAESRTAGVPKDRMESLGREFFRRVAEGFDTISAGSARFHVMDATGAPEEIHRQIREVVERTIRPE